MAALDGLGRLTVAGRQRVRRSLAVMYAFEDGAMTLDRWLQKHGREFTHKTKTVREYSTKRVCLEYVKLKRPKVECYVWMGRNGALIPKCVWDVLDLPESEPESV